MVGKGFMSFFPLAGKIKKQKFAIPTLGRKQNTQKYFSFC